MNPGNKQLIEIYFQPVHKTFLGKRNVHFFKKMSELVSEFIEPNSQIALSDEH